MKDEIIIKILEKAFADIAIQMSSLVHRECKDAIIKILEEAFADTATQMSNLVHRECKDVPHDIGLRLMDIVMNNIKRRELPKRFLVKAESPEHAWKIQEELIKRGIDFIGGNGKPQNLQYDELVFSVNPFFMDQRPRLFYGPVNQYQNTDTPWLTLEQIKNCH